MATKMPVGVQRGPTIPHARHGPSVAKCEAAGPPPPGKRWFPRGKDLGRTLGRFPVPPAARLGAAPAPACYGRAATDTEVSAPKPVPLLCRSRTSGLRGERTTLANNPRGPSSPGSHGARNRSGPVAETYSSGDTGLRAQPAGFLPGSPGGRGPSPGRWLADPLPLAVRLGLTIRTPRTRCRDPRGVSGTASREARVSLRLQAPRKEAGCALGGGSASNTWGSVTSL